jgi:predicted nucleic acid-binding protein
LIVVDTNAIAYLLIAGEHTRTATGVLRKDSDWVAPVHWRSEFRNVLAMYIRRGHLNLPDAVEIMEAAELLMRESEFEVISSEVLRLVSISGCSAYDCEFLALAHKLGVPLVTSDTRILKAFPLLAVSPGDFVS